MSVATRAVDAVREACAAAQDAFGPGRPKLAIVFTSVSYEDVASAPRALREALGDVAVVGGTAGGRVFGTSTSSARGVSVVLLGGDDLEVLTRSAVFGSPEMLEAVPAARDVARAADAAERRGLVHGACLVFAPGIFVDGEALVAAVRKGAGARTPLAGGLTGDDFTMDRPGVLVDGELRSDRVVVAGLFTRSPIGIAARHGWRALGPARTVTRSEGAHLICIDGRPALDVWLEDAATAGLPPPDTRGDALLYLAHHFPLGIAEQASGTWRTSDAGSSKDAAAKGRELVARTPFALREDGTVQLSASIAEGTTVRVLHGSRDDLLRASREAADSAIARAGGSASGALVLACTCRLATLGPSFDEEAAKIGEALGAPFAGACVFGEISRTARDEDAFFNTTVVVVAFGAAGAVSGERTR